MPVPSTTAPADLAAWNRRLNRTHAMASLRDRAGLVVRSIEARRRRLVAARVLAGPHARVVDVGCEDGWMAAGYAHAVEALTLVDLDPRVLERSRVHVPRARLVVADATDPRAVAAALAPSGADVVVLSALLEHVPDPHAVLDALAGALAPGGRFVVYLPADGPILAAKAVLRATRLAPLVRGLSLEPAPGHLHRFGRADVVRLLAAHGRVQEVSFDPLVLGHLGVVTPPGRPAKGR